MSDYAGEKITLLITDVRDSRDNLLDDTDLDTVTVVIYDTTGAEVQAETVATWDPTLPGWWCDWDSTGNDAGRYIAEVRVNSVIGPPGLEYLEFYLEWSPVPLSA